MVLPQTPPAILRKIAAILLLCLYTFNLVGYHVVFHLLEKKAEQNLQASLDGDAYSEAELITLNMPLHLPYVGDSPSFERVDGEITKDGRIYHFVKRAIRNGSLVLLCLPNQQKMQLESVKSEFSKQTADDQGPIPSKKSGDRKDDLVKNFRAKYLQASRIAKSSLPILKTTAPFRINHSSLEKQPRHCPEQPPELS